jgi:RsiW-degrading membrane proteinase PrsW (M82 family)
MPIISADVPYFLWRLQALAYYAVLIPLITALVWIVYLPLKWIAPTSGLTILIDTHFVGTIIFVWALFFFYSFFRMVWEGISAPTVMPLDAAKPNETRNG